MRNLKSPLFKNFISSLKYAFSPKTADSLPHVLFGTKTDISKKRDLIKPVFKTHGATFEQDLNNMFAAPDIKAIFIAKGGKNSNITFDYLDIKGDELVPFKGRNSRANRVKPVTEEEKKANMFIPKPKKVTPGYKKKMQEKKQELTKKFKHNKRK